MARVIRSMMFAAALVTGGAVAPPALADSVSVTRYGAHGGHMQRTTACRGGAYYGGCRTNWTYTSPHGRTWSGQRATGYGPRGGAGYRTVTGPRGNTVYRGGAWRRW